MLYYFNKNRQKYKAIMNTISTAVIEALLSEERQNNPQGTSEDIWSSTFFRLRRWEDVRDFIDYGFNPETPSSNQLINQDNQSHFGSKLYTVFVEKGRNPHTLRPSETLIFSLSDVLNTPISSCRFSLSDVGHGVFHNIPVSWAPLKAQNLLDWALPCAEKNGVFIYPAELALISGNVALAHRILSDGGSIQTQMIFPVVVQKFLQHNNSNAFVSNKVWNKLIEFNSSVCQEIFDNFASEKQWSREERAKQLSVLEQGPKEGAKPKVKNQPKQNFDAIAAKATSNRRKRFIEILRADPIDAMKEVLSYSNKDNYDIAHCVFDKENCSLNCLDDTNPLTEIVRTACTSGNSTSLRFLLSKGLKADQLVCSKTGNTALHLWMAGPMYLPLDKEFLAATRALLKSASNCSAINNDGETALFSLTRRHVSFSIISPIVELMVQRGLDVRVRNKNNQTAADVILLQRSYAVSELLKNLERGQDKDAILKAVNEVATATLNKRRM